MATKLTNEQKLKIQEKLKSGIGTKDIAKELNVPLSALTHYVETLFQSLAKVKEINKKVEAEKPKNVKDLMVTTTRDQRRKGVAIMTREASEKADLAKTMEGDGGLAFRERYKDSLHTINGNENG